MNFPKGSTVVVCKDGPLYAAKYHWCIANFGLDTDRWFVDSDLHYDPEFVFSREEDALLFILRWT
jgi:hypothetical protein